MHICWSRAQQGEPSSIPQNVLCVFRGEKGGTFVCVSVCVRACVRASVGEREFIELGVS